MSNVYLTPENEKELMKVVEGNKKYKLLVLLMLDAGLRVTEAASLQVKNIDVGARSINVASLKKKSDKPVMREIAMTKRLYEALADYTHTRRLEKYIFPTNSKNGHITRICIWKWLKKHTSYAVKPHDLRHAFASKIVNEGNDIRVAQDLLGHSSSTVTEVYLHRPRSSKLKAIESIENVSFLDKLKSYVKGQKKINIDRVVDELDKSIYVGHKTEYLKLNELYSKKINTIILGQQGIGKSKLIESLKGDKVLRLDDFRSVKKTLANILLEVYKGEKQGIIDIINKGVSVDRVMTKESSARLIDVMIKGTEKNEYTLLIDDLTNVTATGVTALEKLKDHFHVIACARRIKIQHSSFLTNFQRIEMKQLQKTEAAKLIFLLSRGFKDRIENYESYKTHIVNQSDCVPLHIRELVERFSKEHFVSVSDIEEINHFRTKNTFDFSFVIVLVLSSLMVLRYVGGELDSDSGAFKLIGGIFLVFALFARSLFRVGRKKFA